MDNKAILDLPIVTINKGLFPVFEDYMNEIQLVEEQQNKWSNSVRRYLIHSLSNSNLAYIFSLLLNKKTLFI